MVDLMPELAFPDPPLADEVVALRPWREVEDRLRIMAFADPSVLRFSWPLQRAYTGADARAYLATREAERRAGEALGFAFVAPGDPARLFGGGSLYGIDPDGGRAAVGYWLTPDARGRGIATHATRLLARWAFDGLGVRRLELTCAPDNERSQAVAERCGFTREGVLRSHLPFQGERRDTVMYSLLPGELR
jgi:RimJ/RimL family protein N-acetyltransferase